jgi:NADP-dependent alcohol dehydrogenase
MLNFTYKNSTEILFGQGMISEITSRVPQNVPVLLAYGGGSIKRNGVYDQVCRALSAHHIIEFPGIEANPQYETCLRAVEVVRREKIGFIMAVGGGSVLDAAKFIAAATVFEGPDPWEILRTVGAVVRGALPLGTVLTLPATGSECNGGSVISRKETQEKLFFLSPHVFPVFSVLDPVATFTLPPKQVRNGIVDAFVHVCEQYLTYPSASLLQDRLAESVLQTLVEVGPVTLAKPEDYDARANFMWSATIALNNLLGCGVPQDWTSHMIGHELTAYYGLDHAETLAIALPGVWRHRLAQKRAKLEQYGRRVWNVGTAEEAIAKTEDYFHSLGMPTRLGDYRITASDASEKVSARFAARNAAYGERADFGPQDAGTVLLARA